MDGEEEKKVDTQTTETATNTNGNGQNANQSEENTQQNESKTKDEGQNNGQQADDTDAKVANAFGNVDETNKTEEKKGKKANSVAQANEDGSISFKSQEELEGFINKMFRKGAKSAEQKSNGENEGDTQDNTEGDTNNNINNNNSGNGKVEQEKEETSQATVDMTADIALALVEADIDPKKARRAARLIDANKVIIQGTLDTAKLQEEINILVAEWPELKSKSIENQGSNAGFKFGASQENDSNSEEAEISKIFGNSKE